MRSLSADAAAQIGITPMKVQLDIKVNVDVAKIITALAGLVMVIVYIIHST